MCKGPEVGKSWECLRDWKEGVTLGQSMHRKAEKTEALVDGSESGSS